MKIYRKTWRPILMIRQRNNRTHGHPTPTLRKMVNLVAAAKPLMHRLMKMAGVVPHAVEIEPGTVINIWIPRQTKMTTKPAVVLVHGFAADGITTWLFQVGSLTNNYSVYVPDLLFFGGSTTDSPDRSPAFQAECLVKGLRKLGVERCRVVGFSYGGMVAFKMAELHPELVEAMLITGAVIALTESIRAATLERLRYSSFSELLLPESIKGCKALLRVGMHRKLWFPDCLYKDFLQTMFINTKERGELLEELVVPDEDTTIPKFSQTMFINTKERGELLEELVVPDEDTTIPKFSQRIHLVWGEQDEIFKLQVAHNMKEQLGDKATCEMIPKAGHLLHLERPSLFNTHLNHFLASLPPPKS